MNILIVEDDSDVRSALALVLRDRGQGVAWAEPGEGGLEKRRSEDIDVVLLDLELGSGMSGWDVARHKLKDPKIAHIPIIITSGLSAASIHSRGNEHPLAGAILILGKPIDVCPEHVGPLGCGKCMGVDLGDYASLLASTPDRRDTAIWTCPPVFGIGRPCS